MNEHQQRELAAGLNALAATTTAARASAQVEVELAAALRRKRQSGPVTPVAFGVSRKTFLPLAASLLLATAAGVWMARGVHPGFVEPVGFIALPAADALPQMESATIVRVSLPVAALPAYGVAIADRTGESVEAELLVAQDGQARAIRLVNDSD